MITFNEVKNKAVEVWKSDNVILPSVTLAQFILESASGTSLLAVNSNNLFGIKASAPWTGEKYIIVSNEEIDYMLVPKQSAFRKYSTWEDSVQDHSNFFVSTNSRKSIYKAVIGERDYKKVCNALSKTYATDSSYGTKLISIIEKNNLMQYDKQEENTMLSKIIVIDDGHGGTDNGASSNGILEDNWNLEVCAKIEQKLKNLGHTVYSTRNSDVFVGLSERAVMANNWNADIFISCHVNAGGGSGYEDFIFDSLLSNDIVTPDLQNKIHAAMIPILAKYGLKNRGKKRANFAVLRETDMPAILLEAAFLDNATDAAVLKNDQFKEDYAQAVVNGVQSFYGISEVVVDQTVYIPEVYKTINYNVVITSGGYSIDSKPWGTPGFEKWGVTDDFIGRTVKAVEENISGEYINTELGWIDKRAIEKEKVVVESILYLPNGNSWTIYPENGPYTAGDVISLEGPKEDGGLSFTVLGDKGNNIIVVDLPNFGVVGIYFDKDKKAEVTKKYAE